MLALQADWGGGGARIEPRIAAALGLFAGRAAGFHQTGALGMAHLPSHRRVGGGGWRPAQRETGGWVLFSGMLDNAAALAAELGLSGNPPPDQVYAAALDRLGDSADRRCIGHYCAISSDAAGDELRLARSPNDAPPLHYTWSSQGCTVASVPRVLAAAGLPLEIDPVRFTANFSYDHADQERGWYKHTWQVPLGSVVILSRTQRQCRIWYDPLALPVRKIGDAEALSEASRLLDEAARVVTAPWRKPAVMLSGGLDSPLVASAILRARPDLPVLPAMTFRPEAGWTAPLQPGWMGDESALVSAFAAANPRIALHSFDNRGRPTDYRMRELFQAMGTAPAGLPNFFPYHALWEGAVAEGCDGIVCGDAGNLALTQSAPWAPPEFLASLRWGELWQLLRGQDDDRSMLRRLLADAVLPLAPPALQRALRKLVHGDSRRSSVQVSPLRTRWQSANSDYVFDNPTASRWQYLGSQLAAGDAGGGDIVQGFQQLYGIGWRDVMSYRPLFEFCLTLPTAQFVRGGVDRWLARRLGAERLPPEVTQNRQYGFQHADWKLRLLRERDGLLAALDRWQHVPELTELLDLERIAATLHDLENIPTDASRLPARALLTRGVVAAQFIGFVKGSNAI